MPLSPSQHLLLWCICPFPSMLSLFKQSELTGVNQAVNRGPLKGIVKNCHVRIPSENCHANHEGFGSRVRQSPSTDRLAIVTVRPLPSWQAAPQQQHLLWHQPLSCISASRSEAFATLPHPRCRCQLDQNSLDCLVVILLLSGSELVVPAMGESSRRSSSTWPAAARTCGLRTAAFFKSKRGS